ncbi:MAG: hypothetical protein FWC40_07630, partial [Proteobacteria bacterium]|nr:hypothetical protein [Pseudomonadota bacterium]
MDEYRQRESLSFDKVSRQKRRSRYLKWSFDNPLLVGGFVIVVFLCLVMVMGTSMGPRSGIIQRSDIGSIALYDFKAPRDFVYERVDRDATERVRAQRMADVLPIFRWESAYRDSVIAGVTRGFESMRERLMRHREAEMFKRIPKILGQVKLSPEEARRYALLDAMFGKFDQDPAFEPFLTTRPLRDEEIKDSVAQWSSLNHPELEAVMGHFVDPEVFAWFVANNFSKSLQDSLIQVLDTVLSRKIVTSRLDLDIAPRINVQWQEGGERRTQRFDESDKAIISTVETSLSLMRSLLEERITDAPEEVRAFFLRYVRANLEYDEAATQRERQSVSDRTAELRIIEEFKRGQTIVSSGDPIKLEHFELFEKMLQAQDEIDNRAGHWFGVSAIMALLMFLIWYPLVTANPGGRNRNRDIVFLATSVLAFAVCLRLAALLFSALDSVYHFSYSLFLLFPFAAGGMLVRLVVNRLYSYIFAIIAVILTTLLPEDQTMLLPYAFMCAMSGSLQMERPKRTNAIFRRGIVLGLMAAIMGVAIYCFRGIDISLRDGIGVAILGLGSGLFSAGVVMIGLPLT